MTLVAPISASSFRPVQAQPIIRPPKIVAVTPIAVTNLSQDKPVIVGITLDNIPFIGDAAILIDDLPQTPKAADTPPSALSLTNAAARSYLEAKSLTAEPPRIGTETPQPIAQDTIG